MTPDQAAQVAQVRKMAIDGSARLLRTEAHMSRREMARAIGVDPVTVLRWEAGAVAPRPDAAVRWYDVLLRLSRVVAP